MLSFDRLALSRWRQFDEVDIDLSRRFTILTGQNGCGKTTILTTLSWHFGWSLHFISTPFSSWRAERLWSDVYRRDDKDIARSADNYRRIGEILYSNGGRCGLGTSTIVGAQYSLNYESQQSVVGLHVPSHRPAAVYHNITQIPTNPTSAQEQYQQYQQLLLQAYSSGSRQNPGTIQKQSIISLAVFGYGNPAVQENMEYISIFEGFQDILRKILPDDLGFERLEVRMPEVVLVTRSGDFTMDAMSGGINALFGIAWQLYMFGIDKENCTVTIDEPENHLHPSMQRSLLPSLARAFPSYKFIVATHSPFIISSFEESAVYALSYNENRRIYSHMLEASDLSGTPNKVLREILDVSSNLPIWVESRVREILERTAQLEPHDRAIALMEELRQLGLADSIPEIPN